MFEPRRGPLFELSGGGLKPSRGEGWVEGTTYDYNDAAIAGRVPFSVIDHVARVTLEWLSVQSLDVAEHAGHWRLVTPPGQELERVGVGGKKHVALLHSIEPERMPGGFDQKPWTIRRTSTLGNPKLTSRQIRRPVAFR